MLSHRETLDGAERTVCWSGGTDVRIDCSSSIENDVEVSPMRRLTIANVLTAFWIRVEGISVVFGKIMQLNKEERSIKCSEFACSLLPIDQQLIEVFIFDKSASSNDCEKTRKIHFIQFARKTV